MCPALQCPKLPIGPLTMLGKFPFRQSLAPALTLAALVSVVALPARADNFTLAGTFTHDDQVQLFDLAVGTPGPVDIRSYGYAGGITSTGGVSLPGGFDTILTLFDASGKFLTENDEGAGVAVDPNTGEAFDARITTSVASGNYIVALTQYDSFANGSNLSDGFAEDGHPNFTADPSFATGGPCPGNMFRDISGTAGRCRNGDWAVDFLNVANVTARSPIPEPTTAGFLGISLAGLLWLFRKKASRLA